MMQILLVAFILIRLGAEVISADRAVAKT